MACREEGGEKMIWLEMLARIVVLHMIGAGHDGYDDN